MLPYELISRRVTGPAIWDRVHFTIKTTFEPDYTFVKNAQIAEGYHPVGYEGPWSIESRQNDKGEWFTIWSCSASCD